jgi:hypothetical protein
MLDPQKKKQLSQYQDLFEAICQDVISISLPKLGFFILLSS